MYDDATKQELEMIDISIDEAKATVARAEALRRLFKNKDFKKVFTDHFLGSEVARTVKLMADPTMQDPRHQQALNNILIAVGQVDQFMRTTLVLGDMAQQGIVDSEATREMILQDAAEGDEQ